ncbi:unnamed protein product [Caenorhabditis bovis]|uniref:Anaphase-promoting complex subunit 4 WD40 domain-containing protein n=1 Tax=Caenorhabditis bovis TaxID=2654633 RepID=A0A8S1FDA9_9PELO|nr:unnamed protein product [Caenorhabditis bovis]
MYISKPILKSMEMGKTYPGKEVICMDYEAGGNHFVAGTKGDEILIYDMSTGERKKILHSKKYGVGHIRFFNAAKNAVHSSTKVNHVVRYLSLEENKYISYFIGHQDSVTGLYTTPSGMLLTSSLDKTLRLWDIKSNASLGIINFAAPVVTSYDPDSVVFGVGISSTRIALYDVRSYEKGPFNTLHVKAPGFEADWTHLMFSPCGKRILLCTNGTGLILLDAFSGKVLSVLRGHKNDHNEPLEATFTNNSEFVLCGSSDRRIYAWELKNYTICHSFSGHDTTPRIVQHSLKDINFASADSDKLALWCPTF